MQYSSPWRRFVTVSRKFGVATAARVAYSKVRGIVRPGMALPGAPVYDEAQREISFFLGTAVHGGEAVEAVCDIVAVHGGGRWEVCVCERGASSPEAAGALARSREALPCLRIVSSDDSVDDATAARWTLEQATGEFVALLAPGYRPEPDAVATLLVRLRQDRAIDAAALTRSDADAGKAAGPDPLSGCVLVLYRKSAYLADQKGAWPIAIPNLAGFVAMTKNRSPSA